MQPKRISHRIVPFLKFSRNIRTNSANAQDLSSFRFIMMRHSATVAAPAVTTGRQNSSQVMVVIII